MVRKCSCCLELEQKLNQHEEVIAQLVEHVAHVHRRMNISSANENNFNKQMKKLILPY